MAFFLFITSKSERAFALIFVRSLRLDVNLLVLWRLACVLLNHISQVLQVRDLSASVLLTAFKGLHFHELNCLNFKLSQIKYII